MTSEKATTHGILIVEDEVAVREVLVEALTDEGFRTVAARDGADAVDRLQEGVRPCLIVLDLMMPRMSGWEFAAWLTEQEGDLASIPFIVVTAHGAGHETEAVGRAAAFLPKPIRLAELIDVVGRHCPGSRLEA